MVKTCRIQPLTIFCPQSIPVCPNNSNSEKQIMSTFDPSSLRKAVAEFSPRRPQKFRDISPAREVIVELRQKRASYRSIAELLTKHCLPISKTAVAAYCHEVLGEMVRQRRRPSRKLPAVISLLKTRSRKKAIPPTEVPNPQPQSRPVTAPPRPRGPRIAQVRMVNP